MEVISEAEFAMPALPGRKVSFLYDLLKDEISRHYNSIKTKAVHERNASRIVYQRNFNNWIKFMLIQEATSLVSKNNNSNGNKTAVLELCCGRGQDLLKWHKAGADELVGVDFAAEAVKQAEIRYADIQNSFENQREFIANFVTMDCTQSNLFSALPSPNMEFDIVSCQFALHYAFRSERALRQMLFNVSKNLKSGGYFIGTIPDAECIVQLLQKSTDGKYQNDVLSIEYIDKSVTNWSTLAPPLFGAKIYFGLDEQVNCPEFLAYFPLLEAVCKDFDLELVYSKNFAEAFEDYNNHDHHRSEIINMRAFEEYPLEEESERIRNIVAGRRKFSMEYAHVERKRQEILSSSLEGFDGCLGTLSKSEWEVVALYQTFMFRKI